MVDSLLPSSILQLLKPQQVRSYALAKGWQRIPGVNGDIALFQHPAGQWDQLIVPMDESLDDYPRRLRDVIENLANFENRPVEEVLNDLLSPDADILRYRVISPATGRGTIPLVDGIQLLEGARRSILAAACSVVQPHPYHPRMSRTEAQQLLNACQLGQTERGSYSVSIACPLRAVEQDQDLLPDIDPFTRQAIALLMRSVSRIISAIEADTVPAVFDEVPEAPVVSANLCEALLQAQPQDGQSVLDVSASWATTLPPKTPLPTKVRIKHEYFPIIQDISRKLRPAVAPTADLFVGYIANLGGQPGEDGRMQGEATLSIVYEEQIQSARVDLSPEWWGIAHAALGSHGIVRFRGVFHRGARLHRITNITEFALVQ
ncbi:MAG: hypothetical protein EA424_00980 [Planctomycetaceae bacterium]|nr:MAG: hypothetical protein EA424_00980 [Planctomycetaceae bacterium]